MKLKLLSLLTKIPICEICACHLYNTLFFVVFYYLFCRGEKYVDKPHQNHK